MRILLTGAGGQLASDLSAFFANEDVSAFRHTDLDVGDRAVVDAVICKLRPDCILNTAAFNLVDACEDRTDEAYRVNAIGPYNLAQAAQAVGATFVHFSTNYVFDGSKRTPYTEQDIPRPLCVYGMSKLAGEWAVRQYCEKHFVIRTAALYGSAGNQSKGGNFIERLVRSAKEGKPLRVVEDQMVNPTNARDVAGKIAELLATGAHGLYHIVNTGACSWFELASVALERLGIHADLKPASTATLAAKARRPAYSALENAALRAAGVSDLRPWREALEHYLEGFKLKE